MQSKQTLLPRIRSGGAWTGTSKSLMPYSSDYSLTCTRHLLRFLTPLLIGHVCASSCDASIAKRQTQRESSELNIWLFDCERRKTS